MRTKTEESRKLGEYIDGLKNNLSDLYAIQIYLSRLRPYNREPHQLKTAANSFKQLFQKYPGEFFQVPNGDIIYIVRDASIINLERLVRRFKSMMPHDPITNINNPKELFYSLFDLSKEYNNFLDSVSDFIPIESTHLSLVTQRGVKPNEEKIAESPNEISVDILSMLQNMLRQANISNFLRRQSICWIEKNAPPHPTSFEYFISVNSIQEALAPEVNLLSNIWLFKHLTLVFDKRVLALGGDFLKVKEPKVINLNLNIRTLLTKNFRDFEENLLRYEKTLCMEIDFLDIAAHPDAFFYISEMASEKGHKICIDNLNTLLLASVNFDLYPVDHFKVMWSPTLSKELQKGDKLKKNLSSSFFSKAILAHCDDINSINAGLDLGINMFQGRYIEKLRQETKT